MNVDFTSASLQGTDDPLEERGIGTMVAFCGGAFLLVSVVLVLALTVLAPADLSPLRASEADLRNWALAGRYPLIEAARAEARRGLTVAAMTQTYGAYLFLFTVALYFGARGFLSTSRRGWSNTFWILSLCAVCFAPAVFPRLSVPMLDYAVTSSLPRSGDEGAEGHRDGGAYAQKAGRNVAAPGSTGMRAPTPILIGRGLLASLIACLVAVFSHDASYRFHEFCAEYGLLGRRRREDPQHPRHARAASPQAQRQIDNSPAFGQRRVGSAATSASLSADARACQALGVRVGASKREIERAYRTLMKRAHPDHGGSLERAAALNEARDVLLRRK